MNRQIQRFPDSSQTIPVSLPLPERASRRPVMVHRSRRGGLMRNWHRLSRASPVQGGGTVQGAQVDGIETGVEQVAYFQAEPQDLLIESGRHSGGVQPPVRYPGQSVQEAGQAFLSDIPE